MAFVSIFAILFLVINFALSLWNAYASGYNIGMCRKNNIEGLQKYASYSGLGLAFAGMAYVLIAVISILAYYVGYVDANTAAIALSYNFLVFGLLIICFGMLVTIQSIITAYKNRSFWSILIALWNVFAEIWDIYAYIQGFKEATAIIGGGNRKQQGQALVIVLIGALLAFFIVHAAYRHGYNKAMDIQPQQGQQQSQGGNRMMGQRVRRF